MAVFAELIIRLVHCLFNPAVVMFDIAVYCVGLATIVAPGDDGCDVPVATALAATHEWPSAVAEADVFSTVLVTCAYISSVGKDLSY